MARGVNDSISQRSIDAFWSKVKLSESISECWNWMGAKKPKGYGNVRINSKYMLAHRVAFELSNNIAIPDGMIICHTCDNPSCCNPAHLMLGTIKSNYFDMINKGRQEYHKNKAKGELNRMSKLNAESVKLIREIYQRKEKNQYELADMFNVSQPCIGSIVRNETWRHING